jgi:hypothetical protein
MVGLKAFWNVMLKPESRDKLRWTSDTRRTSLVRRAAANSGLNSQTNPAQTINKMATQ